MGNNKRNQKIKKRFYASTALFLLVGAFLLPEIVRASAISDENIINITNKVRQEEGLNNLSANQLLSKAAYDKADAIFRDQVFQHDIGDKRFSKWVKEAGYQYESVGENLAIDFVSSEGAMDAWLSSPSHKKNILNPKFQEIGVAVKEDSFEGRDSLLIVQIFGTPSSKTVAGTDESIPALLDEESLSSASQFGNDQLMSNSAPHTLLVANTESGVEIYGRNDYLYNNEIGSLGQSLENIQVAFIYIVDYTGKMIMQYYWTLILVMIGAFSYFYIWHRRNLDTRLSE